MREDLDMNEWGNQSLMARRLDEILILDNGPCKKFTLDYEYFKDPAYPARSESKRLKLVSVQEKSCNTPVLEIPPYTFDYEGILNSDGTQFLPHRLHKGIDHWGYYNGAINNENIQFNVPLVEFPTVSGPPHIYPGTANREPDSTKKKMGMLKTIYFPTGGSTDFEFESNTVYQTYREPVQLLSFYSCEINQASDCCGTLTESAVVTFEDVEQIQDGRLLWTLYADPEYSVLSTCNVNSAYFNLMIYNDNTNQFVGGNISVNLNIWNNEFEAFFDTALYLMGNFSPGIPYRFEITSDFGVAHLELYSSRADSGNVMVSGNRVKKITIKDGISPSGDKIVSYDYTQETFPGRSSGVLFSNPRYAYNYLPASAPYSNLSVFNAISPTAYLTIIQSESIVPLGDYDGNPVGYSRVTKREGTGQGRTVWEYKTGSISNPSFIAFPLPPQQLDVLKGTLLKEQIYSESNLLLYQKQINPVSGLESLSSGIIHKLHILRSCVDFAPDPIYPIIRLRFHLFLPHLIIFILRLTRSFTRKHGKTELPLRLTINMTRWKGTTSRLKFSLTTELPNISTILTIRMQVSGMNC
ncbi:MAG: hypothetical protein R3C61_08315 [Bacteroidia bacterium]